MRVAFLAVFLATLILSGCASSTEEHQRYRTEQAAGGSLPWNRPQSWEGPGALGSQMNQFSQ